MNPKHLQETPEGSVNTIESAYNGKPLPDSKTERVAYKRQRRQVIQSKLPRVGDKFALNNITYQIIISTPNAISAKRLGPMPGSKPIEESDDDEPK